MRATMARSIFLLAPFVQAADAHASGSTTGRKAQIIVVGSAAKAVTAASDQGAGQRLDAIASGAEDFAVHDLGRRSPAFQVGDRKQATDQATRTWPPGSVTAIPQWILGAPSSSNGDEALCLANPYRPTGFLRLEAERSRLVHYSMMQRIACEIGLPVALFDAMIMRESQYRLDARSPKNAFGLTQLMPGTAQALGVDRYSLEGNLRGGARYLRQQLDRFGYYHLALAAYNAGPSRVRGGRVPAIAETQAYVADVLWKWSRLTETAQPQISARWRDAIAFSRQAEVHIF